MQCAVSDVQNIQLGILKTCRDICQRYGLTYFLFGDTLRGAVRGGKFLSGSTEAALLMPSGDLKNFCAYFAREAPEGLFLSCVETEKEYPYLTVRVRKDNTVGEAERLLGLSGHHGISVSLYPYYPMEVGRLARPCTKAYVWLAERLLGASLVSCLEKPVLLDTIFAKIPIEKRLAWAGKAVRKLEKGSKKSMQVCVPLGGAVFFWREALGEEETFVATLSGEEFRVPDRKEVFLNMAVPEGKSG
ncbi:MAG: LicD family protein [Clostridia bacterium]|nr:LicD family protein [Clostridia bacterium]